MFSKHKIQESEMMLLFLKSASSSFGITNSSALRGLFRYRNNPLIGENGNIYNLIGLASQTLHRHGMEDHAKEMQERITGGTCHSYDQALCILGEYVNITSANDFVWNEGEMNFE